MSIIWPSLSRIKHSGWSEEIEQYHSFYSVKIISKLDLLKYDLHINGNKSQVSSWKSDYLFYQSPVPVLRTVILNKQITDLEPFLLDREQIYDHLRDSDEDNMHGCRGHSPRCQETRVWNALRNFMICRCQAKSERERLEHEQIDVKIAPIRQIWQIPVWNQNCDHLNKRVQRYPLEHSNSGHKTASAFFN